MADDNNSTRQSAEVVLGKKWSNEQFSTVRSVDDVQADAKLQEQYKHENAVPLTVYFQTRGHHDPVLQKMMESFTKVRTATLDAFDEIFKPFFG